MKKIIFAMIIFLFFEKGGFAQPSDMVELGEIVITASRLAQYDYKVAGNLTVINKEQIQASNASNVPDLIKGQLGVHVYDTGTAKNSTVDIRGFGDTAARNTLVLVNDRRVNSVDISGPDLIQIPLESIERIEILRGAGSVLYGDNAVGGVVNIITKKGEGDIHGKAGVTYGSYDSLGEDVEVSGAYKNISYYLYGKYHDDGGYRNNSDLLTRDYQARVGYEFSDKFAVDFLTGWHEDDYRLPGGLNDTTELDDLGRRGSANPNDYASSKDRFFQLNFDIRPWPENLDLGHFLLDFSYRNRDTYAWFDYGAFGATATKRDIETYGFTGKYIFDKTLLNREFDFIVGLDLYDVTNDILGGGDGASISSDDLTISKEEVGGYVFGEYEFVEDLFINFGGRYQKSRYTFDRRDTIFYDTKEPSETVYTAGMKYEYGKGSNVHMNIQQTFRFLATDEWYDTWNGLDTALEHQKGIQYEVGVKHNWNDKILFNVTPYWIDNRDEIYFNPTSGFFGSNSNYDKTRRIGVEAGQRTDLLEFMDLSFLSKMELFTNYTFQDARFRDGDFEKKYIPMVPQHQADVGLDMKFFDKYRLTLSGSYVGSCFAINDTANKTPPVKPYYVMNAKLGFNVRHLECQVSLNNIFNEKYYHYVVKSASSSVKDVFPAPEMNFTVSVKGRF